MIRIPSALILPLALSVSLALPTGCGSGSSSPATPSSPVVAGTGFDVDTTNVTNGEVWPLNRPVDITFTSDVDFATVTPNTVRIQKLGAAVPSSAGGSGSAGTPGEPAVGTFELLDPRTVRFSPTCPSGDSLADAGLQANGAHYTVRVIGIDVGGPTVLSTAGVPVATSTFGWFQTPHSNDPADLFEDTVPGPPTAVVRREGSSEEVATYLELSLDAGNRVYFESDTNGDVALPLGFLAPLNFYSEVESRVAWVVQLDQAINPSSANLHPSRVGLEYEDFAGVWQVLGTEIELTQNCSADGATVRLTPLGLLPQGSAVRAYLRQGFEDLSGDALSADSTDFAPATTQTSFDPGTTTAGDDGDELLETFILSGDAPGSFEDTTPSEIPRAVWGGGKLSASFAFDGTGGPGGTFDWFIPPFTDIIIDTTVDTIVGGPNGVPTDTQTVIGGVIDIRDMFVPDSSRVFFLGPNPVTILASGSVRIEGELRVNGLNQAGVGTLNTTNLPEPGAAGTAGGGRGGTGSFNTTESTPFGGTGFGPFNEVDGGGLGGETSFHPTLKDARRGAGGGGGRFGPDVFIEFMGLDLRAQTLVGLDAEPGFAGGPGGTGAVSMMDRAMGGAIGPSPFTDGDPSNDFFGTFITSSGEAIDGELPTAWAGEGGGGGGDAVRSDSFPLTPFSIAGDEKGAGGGGAAGSLTILAIEEILVTATGSIQANGGHGGGGENTSFFDRVGGGSGGASGGHIVLESLAFIEVAGIASNAGDDYMDDPNLAVHGKRPISALGGQGGTGRNNQGGANESGATQWRCDAIPFSYFEATTLPPFENLCFQVLPDFLDPLGPVVGAGGDGGPGLIQLHVNDPDVNLRFTGTPDGDATKVFSPPPVGWEDGAFTGHLVPRFGPLSRAQSDWIALGGARVDPGGPDEQVELFLGGTDGATGAVQQTGDEVQVEPPLFGPLALDVAPNTPHIGTNRSEIVFDAGPLSGFDDVYERNPELLRLFTVRLAQASAPANHMDFAVAAASYDAALDRITIVVATSDGLLTDFNPGGAVEASLVKRPFVVETNGVVDALPATESVRVLFDAARRDAFGRPDKTQTFSDMTGSWATDISQLNQSDWGFVRFRVEFDLDPAGAGLDLAAPLPSLTHLRVPFRF